MLKRGKTSSESWSDENKLSGTGGKISPVRRLRKGPGRGSCDLRGTRRFATWANGKGKKAGPSEPGREVLGEISTFLKNSLRAPELTFRCKRETRNSSSERQQFTTRAQTKEEKRERGGKGEAIKESRSWSSNSTNRRGRRGWGKQQLGITEQPKTTVLTRAL